MTLSIRDITFCALVSISLLVSGLAGARQPAIKARPGRARWWRAQHHALNMLSHRDRAKVIFLGDSITSGWARAGQSIWHQRYARFAALNLGIGGDATEHLLWRLCHGNLDGLKAEVAVLLIGTNNLRHQRPARVVAGIGANVAELRHRLPRTRVLLLAIFPRGAARGGMRRRVRAVNALLPNLARDPMVHVLDMGGRFLNASGSISRSVMPDALHLSSEGYRRWADAMAPTLDRLLAGLTPAPGFVSSRPSDQPAQSGWTRPGALDLQRYDQWQRTFAKRHGLDWKLAAAVRIKESFNDPNRVSTTGAVGLMQLMPAGRRAYTTASYRNFIKARRSGRRRFGRKSARQWGLAYQAELRRLVLELPYVQLVRRDARFDPRKNIAAGTAHLARDRAKLRRRYPHASEADLLRLTVAAYFTGRGRVAFENGKVQLPSYAKRYVEDVMAVYRRLVAGKPGR